MLIIGALGFVSCLDGHNGDVIDSGDTVGLSFS
jgi:hypothetical protein